MASAPKSFNLVSATVVVVLASGCAMASGPRIESATVDGVTFLQMSGGPEEPGEPDALFEGSLGIDKNGCAVLVDEDGSEHGLILPPNAKLTLVDDVAGISLAGRTYLIGEPVSFGGGFGYPSGVPDRCSYDEYFLPNPNQAEAGN